MSRRRSDGTSQARVSPDHPLLAAMCPLVGLVKKEDGSGRETARIPNQLWQIFRQNPIPTDAEAIVPLDDPLWNLAEVLPSKVGIPEPAVKICYGQHQPFAVLLSVGGIVGVMSV